MHLGFVWYTSSDFKTVTRIPVAVDSAELWGVATTPKVVTTVAAAQAVLFSKCKRFGRSLMLQRQRSKQVELHAGTCHQAIHVQAPLGFDNTMTMTINSSLNLWTPLESRLLSTDQLLPKNQQLPGPLTDTIKGLSRLFGRMCFCLWRHLVTRPKGEPII